MRCEVCGRKIFGQSHRVVIEGAKLTVCGQCSKHGTIIKDEPVPKTTTLKPRKPLQPLSIQSKKSQEPTIDTSVELVENFPAKIRQAREKLGLTHEDIGKKINEKVSLLKKIETGKMTPNNKLAAKLEHTLKVKLLAPASEPKIPKIQVPKPTSRELTMGDLLPMNKKGPEKEDKAERKSS